MSQQVEIKTTVKGGLPIIAKGKYVSAEPDVGLFEPSMEDVTFFWPSGRQVTTCMDESILEADRERVIIELLEAYHQPEDDR